MRATVLLFLYVCLIRVVLGIICIVCTSNGTCGRPIYCVYMLQCIHEHQHF